LSRGRKKKYFLQGKEFFGVPFFVDVIGIIRVFKKAELRNSRD
jgi:hypothetical protein